ncbi:MAG: hypothetical protein LQ346_000706 [Caloplaca aetnensis]|nr:MAG: hypothetical protein LQ346_000706 [Caloplaca aetnensis]
MSVELDPSELGFRRPFSHEVTQSLRLSNPGNETIAFKVKTTAPKQYCVRPNSGKIDARQSVEVQVLLQAMKEDPPPDARCRDKFLWSSIEKANKSSIQERKIRVVFLPPDGSAKTPAHRSAHGQHLGDEAPPAYGSPSSSFGSPGASAATPVNHSALDSKGHFATTDAESITPGLQSTVSDAGSNGANAISTSGEDLRAQLANAKAEISRLTSQNEEQGLRQRKSDAVNQDSRERITTGSTGMGIQQQPADGVPVQIVTALCLLSFLLAYFFF